VYISKLSRVAVRQVLMQQGRFRLSVLAHKPPVQAALRIAPEHLRCYEYEATAVGFTTIERRLEPGIGVEQYIDEARQRAVLEAATPENFDRRLTEMEFSGWSRIAFATTKLGILDVEDSDEGRRAAMDALLGRLDLLQSQAHELELVRH